MKSLYCYASAFAACLSVLQAVGVSANTITIQVSTAQSSIPSGGSVFNPFPLAGASAPIATSGPNVFSPSPSTPVVQPVPSTGVGIFNPFPLSGAALPLSTVGGTVPNPNPAPGGAGVFTSPGNGAAAGATTVIPSTTPTVTSTGVTIPNASNVFVVTVPSNQITLALTVPQSGSHTSTLALALSDPQSGSQTSTPAHLVNPEPGALVLVGTGLGWLAWLRRKNARPI